MVRAFVPYRVVPGLLLLLLLRGLSARPHSLTAGPSSSDYHMLCSQHSSATSVFESATSISSSLQRPSSALEIDRSLDLHSLGGGRGHLEVEWPRRSSVATGREMLELSPLNNSGESVEANPTLQTRDLLPEAEHAQGNGRLSTTELAESL